MTDQPTLETVAAVAGVSRATVSRVINNSPKVSPQVREAVEAAIASTGYVPNRAARTLVTRRTDSVALVVQEPETHLFGDPYLTGIVRSVSEELSGTDTQLVLMMVRTDADQERLERYLRGGHVDGALLVSLHGDATLPRRLLAAGVPVVVGGRPLGADEGITYVDADNVGGASLATRYLHGSGRRRVASIAGPQDMCAGVDRLAGYLASVEGEPLVAHGDFTRESGAAAMRELLRAAPDLDAVFAASDLMAAAAVGVLRESGRRVPDDVAVVGFDDVEAALWSAPPLTTVHQPVPEQGRRMTRLLLDRVLQGLPAEPVVLPTHLVRRESA
ncbi:LacI family DNA-binding transcriptional regulator [Yinghuangia seranimata]|uniref:LacI family DNA-binding transcriptional regulator n=1 Tax=Yinghuangia seranimata TaxID=408067 RepID=UPI00248BBC24|nr:LacI family DNA-binding transcriptional regulator [Yinghuangia seranimata]MDI2131657.1 LacI family DNA-binding transcriptional regulator [Yinghuangia seranimata]